MQKKQVKSRQLTGALQAVSRGLSGRKTEFSPENRQFSGVIFYHNRLYPLIDKEQRLFCTGNLQVNIRCLSGQYQVFIRCFVLQDQDSQARSAALRSPVPAHAPPDYPCLLPGAASRITARRGIVEPPAKSAWSASHQRPGSPWLATPSLRSGSPVSGCRTAAICSSRSSLLSKLFHADVFPNRAGKTSELMGCGLFLPSAAPQAADCGGFGNPYIPKPALLRLGARRRRS